MCMEVCACTHSCVWVWSLSRHVVHLEIREQLLVWLFTFQLVWHNVSLLFSTVYANIEGTLKFIDLWPHPTLHRFWGFELRFLLSHGSAFTYKISQETKTSLYFLLNLDRRLLVFVPIIGKGRKFWLISDRLVQHHFVETSEPHCDCCMIPFF